MKVPLLDLKPQFQSIKDEVMQTISDVCDSQYFILGPEVEALEQEIAEYCNAGFAVGVSSGTDALLLSLMSAEIGAGDEVITSPYTFFATAGCISRLGAKPVFVDIDPKSFNIDVDKIEEKLTARTKAIIPVHLYGQPADLDRIAGISKKHGIKVIEDAAQAIGAEYKGAKAGSIGDYGCFSFFPSKNLGAFGDGGIITTNSAEFAENLKRLRVHGMSPKYYHPLIGGNFRLDALQAAVVRIKLKHLDFWGEQRRKNAELYSSLFSELGLGSKLILPKEQDSCCHVYNQFVVRAEDRDKLKSFLLDNSIVTEIYYPLALHMQECFAYLGYSKGDFPESEKAAETTLALPIYPELSEDQIKYVVQTIGQFYNG